MAEIKLKLNKKPDFPLEAESITTDNFAGKSADDIKKLFGTESKVEADARLYQKKEELVVETAE